MKKTISILLVCLLFILMLPTVSLAAAGTISVNGTPFGGTLAQAIDAAGSGGTVTVSGTVRTYPIGRTDGTVVSDVTIEGVNNAEILPPAGFVSGAEDNFDIITVTGDNVVIRNILFDACFVVDFPLSTFGCNNVLIENVRVQRGKRGGVNIMTGGSVLFKNVTASNSKQAGFYFEACGDASKIRFENCVTDSNWYRSGVLLCNAYAATLNVDASGITCMEGYFSVHDRAEGSLKGKERQEITFAALPKNSDGNTINASIAMNYPLEKAYLCIRFGVTDADVRSAAAYVDSDAYGFSSRIYFDSTDDAQLFLHEGESVTKVGNFFTMIFMWFIRLFNSLRIKFF